MPEETGMKVPGWRSPQLSDSALPGPTPTRCLEWVMSRAGTQGLKHLTTILAESE